MLLEGGDSILSGFSWESLSTKLQDNSGLSFSAYIDNSKSHHHPGSTYVSIATELVGPQYGLAIYLNIVNLLMLF